MEKSDFAQLFPKVDWNRLFVSNDVKAFTADVLGVANVSFKFPDDCLYPCLPVRTDNGLIFPLEGTSNCGSPEIALALQLGAKIEVLHGVIVPWASAVRPFELFSKKVRDRRNAFEKGSIFDKTWKEIGNSLYGKVVPLAVEADCYFITTASSLVASSEAQPHPR